jgi:hypothetical protein
VKQKLGSSVQDPMVRLSMKFALAVLLALGLAIVALEVDGQTAAPQSPPRATAQAKPAQAAAATPKATPHKSRSHYRAKEAEVAETPPAPPPPPPTLEQTPPTAPNVTFTNGELTIDAPNSTLSQVLHAVQSLTGASVDMPGTAANDRVVAHLGPGEPRDVLNTLLNGSKFDYVILGVNGDPGGVQKIILTPRQAGGVTTAQNNQPAPQPVEEDPDEPVAENPYPEPGPPGFHRPGFPGRPGQFNANSNNGENNNASDDSQNSFTGPGGEAQQNGAKTPEQLMQELQQMQQQQQQYEQQLNPANRPPQQ